MRTEGSGQEPGEVAKYNQKPAVVESFGRTLGRRIERSNEAENFGDVDGGSFGKRVVSAADKKHIQTNNAMGNEVEA